MPAFHLNRVSKDTEYTPWGNSPRKRWIKFLKVVIVGCILILAAIETGLMFLDMNTLRESLTKSLSEKTGTQVEIQFLDLGYSHGLGLEAGGLTVRNIEGSQQLLWVESLFLEVKMLPLLTGELVVESAAIIKPRIKVYQDPKDLLKTTINKAASSSFPKRTVG